MKALIQRVKEASVKIDGEIYSAINAGMLVFLGVEKTDTSENAERQRAVCPLPPHFITISM